MEGKAMTPTKRSESAFPSLFDKIFNGDLMDWGMTNFSGPNSTLPAVNVRETKDDYIIELAAPGMKKNDFKIHFQNNVLTISSEKQEETNETENNFTRKEFSYQSFQRSFTVPQQNVETDKISASYSEGILNVKLPKREELKPKPAKEIKIS
jgi:HSP20 family protein